MGGKVEQVAGFGVNRDLAPAGSVDPADHTVVAVAAEFFLDPARFGLDGIRDLLRQGHVFSLDTNFAGRRHRRKCAEKIPACAREGCWR